MSRRLLITLATLLLTGAGCDATRVPAPPFQPTRQLRRPIALAVLAEDGRILAANRDSGTVSLIDPDGRRVIAEYSVGKSLADLALTHADRRVIVADRATNEVLLLDFNGQKLTTLDRVAVDPSPVDICLSADGSTAYVASVWARRLTVLELEQQALRIEAVIDLPFSPRQQVLLGDGKHLAVADAFGGDLAVIERQFNRLVIHREWNAHNMHGMAVTQEGTLLVAHQALMSDFATTADGVHWGAVMMNLIRKVPAKVLFAEKPPPGAFLDYLGTMDDAAGDPGALLVTADNRRLVAIGGTNELAISDPSGTEFEYVPVGVRPAAIALSKDLQTAYVANMYSDSVTVVDLDSRHATGEISLGPQPALTVADRGELLFHDARLSRDGWFSCHSCHTDGHTNGFLNDNFGDDTVGAPKRVPSLLGVAHTGPWTWTGKTQSLSEQVQRSISTTMRGPQPSEADIRALTEYLQVLTPPVALADAGHSQSTALVNRGRSLFDRLGCRDCHAEPHYTSDGAYDVGLTDEQGHRNFNPPSLRGVGHRDRLFHDNRAAGLTEVFTEFQHNLDQPLEADELAALLAFLKTL